MIDLELIKNILDANKSPDADYIYQCLTQAEQIHTKINTLERQKRDEQVKYEQKIKEINRLISDVQSCCPHWTTTYHPDPSGNSDSYNSCKLCGKTF